MNSEVQTTAELWDVDAATYHADHSHVSCSAANVFRRSPREYYRKYIDHSLPFAPQTEAMLLGSLLHCLVLEPQEFGLRYKVAPPVDRRTKDGKAAWQRVSESLNGRTLVAQDVLGVAHRMADAIRTHPIAGRLNWEAGMVEQSIRWQDVLPLKARLDLIYGDLIVDIKSARDPSPAGFSRSAAEHGYHRQARWYMEGFHALLRAWPQFMFVVVGSSEPHDVYCQDLNDADLDLARRQNRKTLEVMAACADSGDWSDPAQKVVTRVSLPAWAHYSDQWEL